MTHGRNPFWTDDRVEQAKALFAEGLTFSAIGRVVGCSRNAAIGKLTRLGVAGASVAPRSHTPAPHKPRPSGPPMRPVLVRSNVDEERAAALALEPLGEPNDFGTRNTCRFPYGETNKPGWRMCGRPGHPWCESHRAIIYQPIRSHHASAIAKFEEAEVNSGIKRAFG